MDDPTISPPVISQAKFDINFDSYSAAVKAALKWFLISFFIQLLVVIVITLVRFIEASSSNSYSSVPETVSAFVRSVDGSDWALAMLVSTITALAFVIRETKATRSTLLLVLLCVTLIWSAIRFYSQYDLKIEAEEQAKRQVQQIALDQPRGRLLTEQINTLRRKVQYVLLDVLPWHSRNTLRETAIFILLLISGRIWAEYRAKRSSLIQPLAIFPIATLLVTGGLVVFAILNVLPSEALPTHLVAVPMNFDHVRGLTETVSRNVKRDTDKEIEENMSIYKPVVHRVVFKPDSIASIYEKAKSEVLTINGFPEYGSDAVCPITYTQPKRSQYRYECECTELLFIGELHEDTIDGLGRRLGVYDVLVGYDCQFTRAVRIS